jgi:hypothetical protein
MDPLRGDRLDRRAYGRSKKRNWVLLNQTLSNSWVLFLDADEFVNDQFCDEVASAITAGRHDGYWLNYTNYFLGRRLRYGVPQRKLAIIRLGNSLYERIDEESWSDLDMEVHEHPIVDGTIGEIRAPIEHNDDRGIEKFIDRHLSYAKWEAHRTLSIERKPQREGVKFTSRQRLKYRHIERWWYPAAYFVYTYFVRFGALDGAAGFQYALYKSWYLQTVRLLIGELRAKDRALSGDNSCGLD